MTTRSHYRTNFVHVKMILSDKCHFLPFIDLIPAQPGPAEASKSPISPRLSLELIPPSKKRLLPFHAQGLQTAAESGSCNRSSILGWCPIAQDNIQVRFLQRM